MDNNIKDDNPSLNKDSALEQQNNMESIKQEILPELTKLQNNVFLQHILDEQTNSFALIYSENQNLINYLSDGLFWSWNNKKLDIILYKLLLQNISYISPLYTPSFNTWSIFYTWLNPEAEEDIAWDNLKKQVETTNPAQRSWSLRYLYTNKDKDITTVLKEI